MNKSQFLTIVVFGALFAALYFGFDTKNKEQKAIEKSRAQNMELISIDRIISESVKTMSGEAKVSYMQTNDKLKMADDSAKVNLYGDLASLWYKENKPLISGHFAEQIAKIKQDNDAWSITGTTYAIAAQRNGDSLEKKHASRKAREAFEKALSLDPANIDNQINLALTYVEVPDEGNPMKGILMLLDLNKEHPDNTSVMMQLGRLALKTNQNEKAVERFSKVIELRPSLREAHCFIAEAYNRLGDIEKAANSSKICELQ